MTDPVKTPTPEDGGNVPTPEPKPAEKKIELTQAEFDQKIKDRLDRAEKAAEKKFQDQIKKLTDQIEEFKGKDLGELEKANQKLEKLKKDLADKDIELTGTNLRLAKMEALLNAGAPSAQIPKLLKRVSGTTLEEIEADIKELTELGWIGKAPEPDPAKPSANGSGKPPVKDGLKKFTKDQIAKMKPEEYEANRADIMKAMEANLIA